MADVRNTLINLLTATHEAYYQAFIDHVNAADPDWPLWYADRLHRPLSALFNTPFNRSVIVYVLVIAAQEQLNGQGDRPWAELYADTILHYHKTSQSGGKPRNGNAPAGKLLKLRPR